MKQAKASNELQFLIDSIKEIFDQSTNNEIVSKEIELKPDLEKIYSLADYHSQLPIAFSILKNNRFKSSNIEKYEYNAKGAAVGNLLSSIQFSEINHLLYKSGIEFLPYKGHVFLEKLYLGKQLRNIGDLDLVVKPQFAQKAIKVLIENGYRFHDVLPSSTLTATELAQILPQTFGMNETTLIKNINGTNHYIDFHWGFHYSFLPYQIDLNTLFENKSSIRINGISCVAPSDQTLLIMLIIHHGGRDCWTSLKYMADLIAFMETLGERINWPKMLMELEEMKLKRPALVGLFLLQEYFEYDLPEIIKQSFEKEKINLKLTEPILNYWENCYDILSLKGRLKYERILWSIQDDGFSRWRYIKEMFKMYSIPNPIESKRLITFPNNYYFLNALSKIITYLYKRGLGKVIR